MTIRLHFIEMCGFRGFRECVRVEFGSGFTVLCGRNGVGKSTLFDGIEFALTGAIDKYAVEKAAREGLAHYVWWRGEGEPQSRFVKVGFVSAKGEQFIVTRTREGGSSHTREEIEAFLCTDGRPEEALAQLTKTSIIRDEWIAALSVDLTETERFERVRGALGSAEGAELTAKAKDVAAIAETRQRGLESEYEALRTQLADRLAQLAEMKESVARAGDLAGAMHVLADALPNGPTDTLERLNAGRAALARRRAKFDAARYAAQQAREIALHQAELQSPEATSKLEAIREELKQATEARDASIAELSKARQEYQREEEGNNAAALLLSLIDHGEQLGLHEGHCPLCAATRTPDEYALGLRIARERVANLAAGMTAAGEALKFAESKAHGPIIRYAAASEAWVSLEARNQRLRMMQQAQVEYFEKHDLDLRFASDAEALDTESSLERDQLIDLEAALRTLEASQGVSQITALEAKIATMRQEAEAATINLTRAQNALTAARMIERAVKRVSAEIIDERLAQISPLLNELYQRLRPHSEWRTIEYSIRGDVRRFLSLKVGDGLNPQFVFSSGQRRAAGLAFLLSVHLSRSWTVWRTLLLDDPVQHIDDFRALQLVEVLAALRHDNRQIVCAVEDAALADLLCRRLSTSAGNIGQRYDFDILPHGSAGIISSREVPPMPVGVLRRDPVGTVSGQIAG